MYELTVDSHFDSAHCLDGYDGKCARLHGHTWLVSATVTAGELDDVGISIDFKTVRLALEESVSDFDHRVLNELDAFSTCNPTAENIARVICERLGEALRGKNVRVLAITISEGTRNRLTYRPE